MSENLNLALSAQTGMNFVENMLQEFVEPELRVRARGETYIRNNPKLRAVAEEIVENSLGSFRKLTSDLHPVDLLYVSSPGDIQRLQRSYPEFVLKPAAAFAAVNHAFARQKRYLDYEYAFRVFAGYSNKVTLLHAHDGTKYDMFIRDVGSQPGIHYKKDRRLVHTCNPCFGGKDIARFHANARTMCISAARRNLGSSAAQLHTERLLKGDKAYACGMESQHCDVTAPYVLFVHSMYDIDLSDFVAILDKSKCHCAFVVLHFHPDILLEKSGELPDLGVRFQKYKANGKRRIRFIFDNDTSMSYDHDFDTYHALISRNVLKSADGLSRYTIEHDRYTDSTMYIKVYRSYAGVEKQYSVFRTVPFCDSEPMVVLYTWSYNTLCLYNDKLESIRLVVPLKLYEKIMSFALNCGPGKFTLTNILTAATAFNSRTVINGSAINNEKPIPPERLLLLVMSIYVKVYIMNFEATQTIENLTNEEKKLRDLATSSTFVKLLKRFTGSYPSSKGQPIAVSDGIMTMYKAADFMKDDVPTFKATSTWFQAFVKSLCNLFMGTIERPHNIFVFKGYRVLTYEEEVPIYHSMVPDYQLPYVMSPSTDDLSFLTDTALVEQALFKTVAEPVQRPQHEVKFATKKFQVRRVPGDGDCFFHALKQGLGISETTTQMRKRLICSKFMHAFSDEERAQLLHSLSADKSTRDSWSNTDTIALASAEYNVQVNLHKDLNIDEDDTVVSEAYEAINIGNIVVVDILFHDHHFDLLCASDDYSEDVYEVPDTSNTVDDYKFLVYNDTIPEDMKVAKSDNLRIHSDARAASEMYDKRNYTKYFGFSTGYACLLHAALRNCGLNGETVLSISGNDGSSLQYLTDSRMASVTCVYYKELLQRCVNVVDTHCVKRIREKDKLSTYLKSELTLKSSEYNFVVINPNCYSDALQPLDSDKYDMYISDYIHCVRFLAVGGTLCLTLPYTLSPFLLRLVSYMTKHFQSTDIVVSRLMPAHNPWVIFRFTKSKSYFTDLTFTDVAYSTVVADVLTTMNDEVHNTVQKAIDDILKVKTSGKSDIVLTYSEFLAMKIHAPVFSNKRFETVVGGGGDCVSLSSADIKREFGVIVTLNSSTRPRIEAMLRKKLVRWAFTKAEMQFDLTKFSLKTAFMRTADPNARCILYLALQDIIAARGLSFPVNVDGDTFKRTVQTTVMATLQRCVNGFTDLWKTITSIPHDGVCDFVQRIYVPDVEPPVEKIDFDTKQLCEMLTAQRRTLEMITSTQTGPELPTPPTADNDDDSLDSLFMDTDIDECLPAGNFKPYTNHLYKTFSYTSDTLQKDVLRDYIGYIASEVKTVKGQCKFMQRKIEDMLAVSDKFEGILDKKLWDHCAASVSFLTIIRNKQVLYGNKRGRYFWCWNDGYEGQFVAVNQDHGVDSIAMSIKHTYAFCSDLLEVFTSYDLYEKFKDYKIQNFFPRKSGLVQAAAGCGKTHSIVESAIKLSDKGYTFQALTSTKEAAMDLTERLSRRMKKPVKAKTIDSFLMNNSGDDFDVLFIDEALMSHAGKLILTIDIAGCDYVRAYGDRLQIPFINRLPKNVYTPRAWDPRRVFPIVDILYISYRVPADIAAVLDPLYRDKNEDVQLDYGMHSYNGNVPSYSIVEITSPKGVPKDKGVKIITFTQADKQTLTTEGYNDVSTAHEFQGKEANTVYLVRLMATQAEIFDTQNQVVTAITRHKLKFVYYHVKLRQKDLVMRLLEKQKQITDDDVVKVYHKPTGGGKLVYMDKVLSHHIQAQNWTINHSAYLPTKYLPRNALQVKESNTGKIYVANNNLSISPYISYADFKSFALTLKPSTIAVADGFFHNIAGHTVARILKEHDHTYIRTGENTAVISSEVYDAAIKSGIQDQPNEIAVYDAPIEHDYVCDLPSVNIGAHDVVQHIQAMLNAMLPGTTYVDTQHDAWQLHTEPFELNVDSLIYNDIKIPIPRKNFDTMRPVLSSPVPHMQKISTRHLLYAVAKRNFNPPCLTTMYDVAYQVNDMISTFVAAAPNVNYEPITLNAQDMQKWANNQPSSVLKAMMPEVSVLGDTSLNWYDVITKGAPKPDLTVDCNANYHAPQTILYQKKYINAVFCTLWGIIRDRIMDGLDKKFAFFTKMRDEDLAEWMNQHIPSCYNHFYDSWEIDMKKFDKSQFDLVLEFEAAILRKFGVPELVVQLWINAHTHCMVGSRDTGIKFMVNFQRKSGDASTFFGNTLFLFVALLQTFGVDNMIAGVFAGDDSWVLTKFDVKPNIDDLAYKYNLEAKIFKFQDPYFCSKFLIRHDDKWYVVPDPLKRAVKLGRTDLRNPDHVEEYRVSFADNVKLYTNPSIAERTSLAMRERYGVSYDSAPAILCMGSLSDRKLFEQLYYTLPGDILCMDPSRPGVEL